MMFDDADKIIQINEAVLRKKAEMLFQRQCGAGASSEARKKMFAAAETVRQRLSDRMNIRTAVCSVPAEYFRNNAVCFENEILSCNYFNCIPEKNVEKIFIFVLTLGNLNSDEDMNSGNRQNEMALLYEEIWTNSYLNTALMHIKETALSESRHSSGFGKLFLSRTYGPGYFGMETEKASVFVRITNAERIGVAVSEDGVMSPGKTYAGLFFLLNRPESEAEPACVRCRGNKNGCGFCSENPKINQRM